MHELSIIASIVDIAEAEVGKAGAQAATRIELEIGELAGVDMAALDFAWDVGVRNSVLKRAVRHIQRTPGEARCAECGNAFPMKELYDPCPACGSYFSEILQGKELRVLALEVEW